MAEIEAIGNFERKNRIYCLNNLSLYTVVKEATVFCI